MRNGPNGHPVEEIIWRLETMTSVKCMEKLVMHKSCHDVEQLWNGSSIIGKKWILKRRNARFCRHSSSPSCMVILEAFNGYRKKCLLNAMLCLFNRSRKRILKTKKKTHCFAVQTENVNSATLCRNAKKIRMINQQIYIDAEWNHRKKESQKK